MYVILWVYIATVLVTLNCNMLLFESKPFPFYMYGFFYC